MVHCVLLPFFVVVMPSVSRLFESPIIEWGLLVGSVLCGAVIIQRGYCQHKKAHSLYIFGCGTLLWLLHAFLHDASWLFSTSILGLGAVCIAVSYSVNHKLLNCCKSHS